VIGLVDLACLMGLAVVFFGFDNRRDSFGCHQLNLS